ncbi:MAG: TfoX/Sxy family protein [Chloroflexi bacterium]|nr:TfoX/Sxy family protein [Chloroflexota bacterium]
MSEKKMFGGLSFMLQGNMACGILKDDIVVRAGSDNFEEFVKEPHARPMDFTGRAMKSMVYVGPRGYASDADLKRWVERGVAYAKSLPAK